MSLISITPTKGTKANTTINLWNTWTDTPHSIIGITGPYASGKTHLLSCLSESQEGDDPVKVTPEHSWYVHEPKHTNLAIVPHQDLKLFYPDLTAIHRGTEPDMVNTMLKTTTNLNKDSIIIIDTQYTNIHPSIAGRLIDHLHKAAKEKGAQLVVATHNPDIISYIDAQGLIIEL